MDQFTRRIIGFAVHAGDVDGRSLCRMFNGVISRQSLPRHLSTDNDPLFRYHQWEANLRILDIDPVKSVPYTPTSHPFIERLIGTVRREYLDQTLFWNSLDLERKLATFGKYYNASRVHSSLEGKTPVEVSENRQRPWVNTRHYHWQSHCSGLISLPVAA